MATDDPATRYLAAKDSGARPQEIYSATKAEGTLLARIKAISQVARTILFGPLLNSIVFLT